LNLQERQRAIQSALVQMDKQFGKGSVLLLGSKKRSSGYRDLQRLAGD